MNKKCQVFTPLNNVIELLDRVEYSTNLYGKKVIENACGDGNILIVIVERYIKDCIHNGIDLIKIKVGLETDIFGAEIDEKHFSQCISNLNTIAESYNIYNVKWKILNIDILRTELPVKFDYVIGNPPYITYRDLDEDTRKYLKSNYDVCIQGKFDYCYAFIEASLKCLTATGKLSYLVPNSIFKNVFARKLREYMLPSLCKIYDYTTKKLFNNALTASAIIVFDNGNIRDVVEYFDIAEQKSYDILKKDLTNKWVFKKANEKKNTIQSKFGDYFTASISIATLLNEAFVIRNFDEFKDYIICNNIQIEKSILREAFSPRGLNYSKKEFIIFPYTYRDNKLMRFTEEEFIVSFPNTTKYLKNNLEKLNKRDSDKSTQWFEYGRTQALAHLNQKKLLLSTVVTKKVKVKELTKECIPYSGIYVVSKGMLSLNKAKEILESKSFIKYVENIGINASGSSLRITAADINNYRFSEQEVI